MEHRAVLRLITSRLSQNSFVPMLHVVVQEQGYVSGHFTNTLQKSTPKNSSLSEDSSDDLYHCIVEHKARRVESCTAQKEEHLKYPLSDLPALNS